MTIYDYTQSQHIEAEGYSFNALIMAAIRQADTDNTERLKRGWPEIFDELMARYWSKGGVLPGEDGRREE